MKRVLFTLCVVLTLATTTAFAGDVKVSSIVLSLFKEKFAGAQNVSWSEANGFTIAEFTLDAAKQFAYFNAAGELTVVAQPLALQDLSKAQQAGLHKKYGDYNVVDIYQLEDNEGVKYFVVVENATQKIILNTTSTKWDVFKTIKK